MDALGVGSGLRVGDGPGSGEGEVSKVGLDVGSGAGSTVESGSWPGAVVWLADDSGVEVSLSVVAEAPGSEVASRALTARAMKAVLLVVLRTLQFPSHEASF